MKFSCTQENLNKGLLTVNHIAVKNASLPILNNVLVEVKDKKIKLSTTNLEMGINCTVRGKIEKEGSYTLPARLFSDYISLLPNKKVDVDLSGERVQVVCENYETKLNGQPVTDFPLIPKIDKGDVFVCRADIFRKSIQQVIFACASSETRPEIGGVFFSFSGDELVLAATDSYRLAEKRVVLNKSAKKEMSVIVPARTLQELSRILSGRQGAEDIAEEDSENVEIYINENQVMFVYDNIELVSRLIEGQYPDYKQIIPEGSKTEALLPAGELLKAVKLGSLFTKAGINDIDLNFKEATLLISSANTQAGENKIKLSVQKKGDDNNIVINYRYLLDGLQSIESEDINFSMTDGNTPCILAPAKQKEDKYLYIIMPIRQ